MLGRCHKAMRTQAISRCRQQRRLVARKIDLDFRIAHVKRALWTGPPPGPFLEPTTTQPRRLPRAAPETL
eukprot:663694-Prymnesium_polylepis.2